MNEGALSSELGLKGWPAVAEESIIARDVLLAEHRAPLLKRRRKIHCNGRDILLLLFIHGYFPPCWTGLLQDRRTHFGCTHGIHGFFQYAAKNLLCQYTKCHL